jgi:membrane protease YdiL (CAAX protease family)
LVVARGIVRISDARVLTTVAVELVLALVMLPYLRRQGWHPRVVARSPERLDLARGFGVFVGAYLAIYIVYLALYFAMPGAVATLRVARITGTLSPLTVMIAAIINPVFEEFLWLGYAIPAVGARYGLRTAIAASVVLRVAAHAYQGVLALVSILPVALVLTWYFTRTGRLWPVIVAHVLADGLALSFLPPAR